MAMIPIITPEIEHYLNRLQPTTDPVLQAMEAYAADIQFPIIGPHVGRLLHLLAKLSNARKILELGSGFGYSAYWLAQAIPAGGVIYCTEFDPQNRERAYTYLQSAGLSSKVRYYTGDALEWIEQLEETEFDMIVNDVDKEDYPRVIEKALPKLRLGGLLITDNVLWKGQVIQEPPPDTKTQNVQIYLQQALHHPDLTTVILPIRDGVAISMKTGSGKAP
ncbi:MAG: O-methyltransferase [Gemmatimonadetes bacterium]|nr:MAG: O-methyltransferase [Gemmatimonadota bacterium]